MPPPVAAAVDAGTVPAVTHTAFDDDFAFFLAHTDEKAVLAAELTDRLTANGARSLLDIGAGDGTLATALAAAVDRYVAVEAHPGFAATLASAGLPVITATFPTPIDETFDAVLGCHVVSFRRGQDQRARTHALVRAAFELLTPGGQLTLVTHRGTRDDWSRLLGALGWAGAHPPAGFTDLTDQLTGLGPLEVTPVTTHLTCATLAETIRGLGFMAAYGREPARSQFHARAGDLAPLLEQYRTPAGYRFPITHLLLTVTRP